MRILLLSPDQCKNYNWTHSLFRKEIGRQHDVVYYGKGYPNYVFDKPIPEVLKDHKPFDIILTYGLKYTEPFIGIGDVIDIPKVHISVDYFPDSTSGTYERNHDLFRRDGYNLYFGVVGNIVRNLEFNKVCKKAHLLPFSIDTNVYKKINKDNKLYDVFAVFTKRSDTYPNRENVHIMLNKIRNIRTFTNRIVHEDYIDKINDSKICITSNNKFRSLSIKYTEVLSCGGFLLADKPEDFDELGYKDNYHLVIYNNLDDLRDKILFYLKHDKLREDISNNGMEFVRNNHNNKIRVEEMIDVIKREFNIS